MAAISKELREASQQPWFPIMMRELGYEPTKHGHWIGIDDYPHETWECDRCGKIIETDEPPNYCERCGADMREERDHE